MNLILIHLSLSRYLDAPIVRGVKRVVYANNYDQVELSCEVKSNPQSIFSWYFGPKELFSSYKYNLSSVIYKQMHRTFLDDMENYHHYRSKLVINSLTQFDFGEYFCRANNIIGESVQIIKLKRKRNKLLLFISFYYLSNVCQFIK